jgi:hypothetical protein
LSDSVRAKQRHLRRLVICEPRLDAAGAIVYDDGSVRTKRGHMEGGPEQGGEGGREGRGKAEAGYCCRQRHLNITSHGNARTERFTRRERKGNGQGHDEAVPSRLVLVLRFSFVSHLHPRRSQRVKQHECVRTPRATSRGKAETSGEKGYSRRADESELRAHACTHIQVVGANAPARPRTHRVRTRIDLSSLLLSNWFSF